MTDPDNRRRDTRIADRVAGESWLAGCASHTRDAADVVPGEDCARIVDRILAEAPATPAPESAAHDRRVAVRVLRWAADKEAGEGILDALADAVESGREPVPGEEDVKR